MLSVALIPFNYSYFSLCSELWFLAQELKEIYIVCFIKSIWNNHICFTILFKLSRWRWLSIWNLDSGWLLKCYSIYGLVCLIDKRKINCFQIGQMILSLQSFALCNALNLCFLKNTWNLFKVLCLFACCVHFSGTIVQRIHQILKRLCTCKCLQIPVVDPSR